MEAHLFGDIEIAIDKREPLVNLDINVNQKESHIKLKNPKICMRDCSKKVCTFICPSFVYELTEEGISVFYQRCTECGACKLVCPTKNIILNYPAGGYGVIWKY